MAVFIADEQSEPVDLDDLVAVARHVMRAHRILDDMELSLLLVEQDAITALNEQHLEGSGPTDVLAFPMDEPGEAPPAGPAVLGDVVLCPAVAAAQARERGIAPHDELRMLTVHGILHLLGMDHAEPEQEREMFGLTEELLASYEQGEAVT